jgi:hypothetical protein
MTQANTPVMTEIVVLDDGVFSIVTAAHADPSSSIGFLYRRCYRGVTTPDGVECVGSYTWDRGGWQARIDAPYDSMTDEDMRTVCWYEDRVAAIVCLWGFRHMALCRHLEDVLDQHARFVGQKLLFKMMSPKQQAEARQRFLDAARDDGFIYELDRDATVLCRRRIPELEQPAYVASH